MVELTLLNSLVTLNLVVVLLLVVWLRTDSFEVRSLVLLGDWVMPIAILVLILGRRRIPMSRRFRLPTGLASMTRWCLIVKFLVMVVLVMLCGAIELQSVLVLDVEWTTMKDVLLSAVVTPRVLVWALLPWVVRLVPWVLNVVTPVLPVCTVPFRGSRKPWVNLLPMCIILFTRFSPVMCLSRTIRTA